MATAWSDPPGIPWMTSTGGPSPTRATSTRPRAVSTGPAACPSSVHRAPFG